MRRCISNSLLALVLALSTISGALAQAAGSKITGSIVDVINGLPVSGASVELDHGDTTVAKTTTDQAGNYAFAAQPAGIYTLVVRANGFQSARTQDIAIAGNEASVSVNIPLTRSATQESLREIGRVTATSNASSALQTSATISRNITTDLLAKTNQLRVGDALQALPGVALRDRVRRPVTTSTQIFAD